MKFYHDENLLEHNKKNIDIQPIKMPFEFCKNIITTINKLKFMFKRTILIISCFILLLISLSFNIFQISVEREEKKAESEGKEKKQSSSDLNFIITGSIKFLFLYEKNLCGFFFFIVLIMFIVYPKRANIIKLAERDGFILFERLSFSFYCSFCYLIYAQFAIFIIYLQISYMNLFLNTLGMLLITLIFSLFNTALFELPLRQLIKSFMNRNIEDRFERIYNNYKEKEDSNNLNNSVRSI